MKRLIFTLFGLIAPSVFAAPPANVTAVSFESFKYTGRDTTFEAPLPAGQFRNPILAGFYPDPSICRVGDDYYLINSTFAYFPGIPIFHSRDLVHWQQIGHAVDRPTQLNYDGVGVTRGLFAPAISYHRGTFYLVCTMIDGGGNFLLTTKNPAGPWSDPIWLKFDGIDPSLFFGDDGRAWLVNNGNPPDNKPLYPGHRAIWLQEFDPATNTLIGPRTIIVNGGVDLSKKPVWIEGPHLYQRDGWFYLCCAEGGTSDAHSQVILRSRAVTGPYAPWSGNPILTQRDLDGTVPGAVTCTGHADLFEGPDGNWWSVFLGCRPFDGGYTTTGRETFLLPVTWTADGWPQILPPGKRVPAVVNVPVRPAASSDSVTPTPEFPLTGNFAWADEFDQPKLSSLWLMLRAPKQTWWELSRGKLNVTPLPVGLAEKKNSSFLGRRVQHARFDIELALDVPAASDVSAGLAFFQSETHHYFFAVRRTDEGLTVFVELADGSTPRIIARAPLGDAKTIRLRLTAEKRALSFSYALDARSDWQTIAPEADVLPVTVQAAGGGLHFTGAVIGPHARLEP